MGKSPESFTELGFPFKGFDRSVGQEHQKPGTARIAQNVRGWDPRQQQRNGCQREGLSKHILLQANGTARIQCLEQLTAAPTVTSGQLGARNVLGIAVAGGTVVKWAVGATVFAAVTSGTTALSTTVPVIFAAEHTQRLYFADGFTDKYYDQATNAMVAWTASAGSIPAISTDRCKLICNWRGRIVLSGLHGDFHNWFMSAVGDPSDWDYGASPVTETMAVAGNNSEAGKLGDFINGLIPAGDDTLIFLCDQSVWRMTGDPMAGGRIDLVSDVVGGAWGQAWCKDHTGAIYFVGSTGGVFKLATGSMQLERISEPIDSHFSKVGVGPVWTKTLARMVWDQLQQGFYLWLTQTDGTESRCYYYDYRSQAWWPDLYTVPAKNPLAVMIQDGDAADDRAILLGCQDGYIRKIDQSANDDDGDAIVSEVYFGPIAGKKLESMMLKEIQAVFANNEEQEIGTVEWSIWRGNSAEATGSKLDPVTGDIIARDPDVTGTWVGGRNMSTLIRLEGTSFYLRIHHETLSKTWVLEKLVAKFRALSVSRQRLGI